MACGESNGHVTDDSTWPWHDPSRLGPNICETAGDAI